MNVNVATRSAVIRAIYVCIHSSYFPINILITVHSSCLININTDYSIFKLICYCKIMIEFFLLQRNNSYVWSLKASNVFTEIYSSLLDIHTWGLRIIFNKTFVLFFCSLRYFHVTSTFFNSLLMSAEDPKLLESARLKCNGLYKNWHTRWQGRAGVTHDGRDVQMSSSAI